jgi:hypothetical protein
MRRLQGLLGGENDKKLNWMLPSWHKEFQQNLRVSVKVTTAWCAACLARRPVCPLEIVDSTDFEHDFLPNWYFHSNRAEDVASDLFIVSQLLSAKDEYLAHTSLDGKKITYFLNVGRTWIGTLTRLLQ